jgi:hypothetical protein
VLLVRIHGPDPSQGAFQPPQVSHSPLRFCGDHQDVHQFHLDSRSHPRAPRRNHHLDADIRGVGCSSQSPVCTNRLFHRFYYQYAKERLPTCTLTIHGLIHVPDDILFCGPSWTTWTFWMERYCGFLKSALRSKQSPWANLNNIILHRAYLEQLDARYDVADELSSPHTRTHGLSCSEHKFDNCASSNCCLVY